MSKAAFLGSLACVTVAAGIDGSTLTDVALAGLLGVPLGILASLAALIVEEE